MNGLLIVDKPKGITSQSVCLRLKRMLNAKKVGHNGTLDPNATGVMVVAVDSATKTLRLVSEHDKEYIVTVLFGVDSDTLDIDGNITNKIDMKPNINDIIKALDELKNEKTQIPPLTSAVKVNGKKLYEYQRKGIDVEVEPRNVTLYDYEIVSDLVNTIDGYTLDIRVAVSKGYFVRSLARDLGLKLNGCAIVKELRRTKSGDYSIENAIKLEDVKESDIIPIIDFFTFPSVEVLDYMVPLVKNGITLDDRQTDLDGFFYVVNKGNILAIYEKIEEKKYKPVIIFGGD